MKSFNHRFNRCCMRVAFWQKLSAYLANLEGFIRGQGHFTPEDVRVLNVVRKTIKDSDELSKQQSKYHSRQLERLRKEYINER